MPDENTPLFDVDVRQRASAARYRETKEGETPRVWHGKLKRSYKPARNVETVRGITLHQVWVNNVGVNAYWKMTAHLAVHHDGSVYWIHPFETYLLHGNRLNLDTIGIEVAGKFTLTTELPQPQIRGLQRSIRFAVDEIERLGGRIEEVWAHRQSSGRREDCPQRAIYQNGVLWAQEHLALNHNPDATRGTGLPIPDPWKALAPPVSPEEPEVKRADYRSEVEGAWPGPDDD